MKITVFGGSLPDEKTRKLAYEIGKRIGKKGYILKNGGYTGVMESSAKGCRETGGKVIGICLQNTNPKIKAMEKPNPYSSEIIYVPTYRDRVKHLMNADRIIVLPGQTGTLEELFVAWVGAIIKDLHPIYIIGKKNKELFNFLLKKKFIKKEEHLPYIKYIESIDQIDFLN